MPTKICLAAALSFAICHSSFGQGALTPSGAPAPTMKSLDQVEARTAITNSGALTISEPGSYYLTRNITVSSGNAITIATNGVTLDLNGFTVRSTAVSATGTAILLAARRNITIKDGFIEGGVTNNGSGVYSGGGFSASINYSGSQPMNVLISRVAVSGCLGSGIFLQTGNTTVVENCTVRTVGGNGIVASTIKTSSAQDCGLSGIFGYLVIDSQGQSTSYADGILAIIAQNSHGVSAGGNGVYTTTAQNCYGQGYSYGVYAGRVAVGCTGISSSGIGLYAQNANTCVGSRSGGTAIQATIANGCIAASGTNNITYKYNMP